MKKPVREIEMKHVNLSLKYIRTVITIPLVIVILLHFNISESTEPISKIINRNGRMVGAVSANGDILNNPGKKIGHVDVKGVVYNRLDKIIGKVSSTGDIFNISGKKIGKIHPTGEVFNTHGKKIGSAEINKTLITSGGGALIFFLQPE